MDLTGKQKALLRRYANEKPIMFQIGRDGLTDNIIKNILDNLEKHEVGRINVLKNCQQEIDDIIGILSEIGVYVVYRIGRVLLLYKENLRLKDRIRL